VAGLPRPLFLCLTAIGFAIKMFNIKNRWKQEGRKMDTASAGFETLDPAAAAELRIEGHTRIPVESSAIAAISYNVAETMEIEFTDGSVYSFPGFSPVELAQFLAAPSKGRYFNSNIRGRF
jgi:KTSC domain